MTTARRRFILAATVALAAAAGAAAWLLHDRAPTIDECRAAGRLPRISPDYVGVVLPPNIAPMNFLVNERGSRYLVRMSSDSGPAVEVHGRSPEVVIPAAKWRRLLEANRGKHLAVDVTVQGDDGRWTRFETIRNTIAREEIDGYLIYRTFKPLYSYWGPISFHQRNLGTFDEQCLLDNEDLGSRAGCMNCHMPYRNRADTMVMQVRGPGGGMLLLKDGAIQKVETRTPRNKAPAAVASWHPDGRLIVFTTSKVQQFFHMAGSEVRDAIDMNSNLIVYSLDDQRVTSTPQITRPEFLEAWPQWSTDGKHLYFCRADKRWTDDDVVPPERYRDVRYSLVRIGYDADAGRWGEVETVLSAERVGKSITIPRFSPDGRWCVVCMSNYSYQASFQADADLYIIDMATGEYRRLECSSDLSESWHSWSSNGRWLAFSSKRRDGQFLRAYFSYIDAAGKAHKPVLMPQENPRFYDRSITVYHVPELTTGPVPVTPDQLLAAIRSADMIGADAVTEASPPRQRSPDAGPRQ